MGEYRAIRLVAKHFNVPGPYVDEDLEVGDFYCYLAEALDAEELQDYRDALLQGGKEAKKKWKWATPDQAGTRPLVSERKAVRQSLLGLAQALTGKPAQKTGTIAEYARATGAQKVYRDEKGNLYDENMKPIESTSGLVFVPKDPGGKPH